MSETMTNKPIDVIYGDHWEYDEDYQPKSPAPYKQDGNLDYMTKNGIYYTDRLNNKLESVLNSIRDTKLIRYGDIDAVIHNPKAFMRLWEYPIEFLKKIKISYENEEVCSDPYPYSAYGKGGILSYIELSKYYSNKTLNGNIWRSINNPNPKIDMMTDMVKMKSFIKFIITFKRAFNTTPWQMIDMINNIVTYRTIVGGSTTKERNNMKKSIKLYGKFTKEYFNKMFGYKLNYDKPTFNKTEMSDFISHTLFIVNNWERVSIYSYYFVTHRNISFYEPDMFNRSDLKHDNTRHFWLKLQNLQETELGKREVKYSDDRPDIY
jgi:hypothetical protein